MTAQEHLPIVPIVLPLAAGAITLIVDEGRLAIKAANGIG
jgi:hypothetical protein